MGGGTTGQRRADALFCLSPGLENDGPSADTRTDTEKSTAHAMENGVHYAYTGNISNTSGDST
jgi:hypothetical protein